MTNKTAAISLALAGALATALASLSAPVAAESSKEKCFGVSLKDLRSSSAAVLRFFAVVSALIIAQDLIVLFAGINPGLYTAAIGRHFGRPGNRFWPALYGGGRVFITVERRLAGGNGIALPRNP